MKKLLSITCIAIAVMVAVVSCKKEAKKSSVVKEKLVAQKCLQGVKSPASTYPYNVYLFSVTDNQDGTFTWEWRVRNLTPGNGKDGTVQDLSHWGITLGACVKPENILSGEYSGNGTSWTPFTPEFKVDPSQDCFTEKNVKFDFGTVDSDISYYRLVIDVDVTHTTVTGYYKSGKNTGCGTLTTCGFGCEVR